MEIKTVAYPKVNLHLAVGRKRKDGYHEIASVFQLVEDPVYKDDIIISIKDSDENAVSVRGLEGIADSEHNTVLDSAVAVLNCAFQKALVEIEVVKNIPSQAGLGGGSSDAAAVIKALGSYFSLPFEKMLSIALSIGSDVPFFMYGCKAAVVTGRGENVFPIKEKELKISLFPNREEKMSTGEAYRRLDERTNVRSLQSVSELQGMYEGSVEDWKFYNDFELVNSKCSDARMRLTGSGTCRYMIDLI